MSLRFGYALDDDETPRLKIEGRDCELMGQARFAWIRNEIDEPKVIDLMKAGREMNVVSTSSRGNETVNTYSLVGFSRALRLIEEACR